MLGALRLILSLTGRHAGLLSGHARRQAAQAALLAFFAVAGMAFLLALVAVALSRWLGVMPALAILTAACGFGCLGVLLAMRSARRAHAAAQRLQAQEDRRVLQAAALTALPALRRGGLLTVAAGALAVALLAGRGRRE